MKKNPMCYMCAWCQQCDKVTEEKCSEKDYILFATKEEKEMCDLICGGTEDEVEME